MIQDFFNILILLGAIQGLLTSILLFIFKSNKNANTILAWLILLISLACLNIYFLETLGNPSTFLSILGAILPLLIFMPIGPLVYFYVKAMLYPDFKLNKNTRPHFYSAIIDLVPYLISSGYLIGLVLGFIDSESTTNLGTFIDTYNVYVDVPRWLSLLVYIWLTNKLITQYRANQKEKVLLNWTRQFTLGFKIFLIIWFIHLVPYIIPSLSSKLLDAVGWYPIYMPLIILIYWLGFNGFMISLRTYNKNANGLKLSSSDIKNTISALENAMKNDKLYLNPSLKLNDLVQHIEIPQKTISAVLNNNIGKTFNVYVNTYRIEAFKARLLEDNSENLTITGLAFECGFNSQATFQRTFKTLTNHSPKEFKQKHSQTE
ncbi:MAG: helix-turn-helix domain-containing protein [Bacteroidota bacterium]